MRCSHGEILHACVHESGHALAALERAVPFVDAVVFGEPEPLGADLQIGGRVKLDDERSWRSMPALVLFEFVLAGACAERALLGHEIPGGWAEDVKLWRQAVGAFDARPPEEYVAILGEPIDDVRARMDRWARSRSALLATIARSLATGRALDESDLRDIVTRNAGASSGFGPNGSTLRAWAPTAGLPLGIGHASCRPLAT